jgi:hypothetical protein
VTRVRPEVGTPRQHNTVWISPGATRFSCLCERCLEERADASSFLDAVRVASVRGELAREAQVAFARCSSGHEVIVRRIDRPPGLAPHDARQMQIQ